MADLRTTVGAQLSAIRQPTTPQRSEAARAAQRAFFDAAMNKTAADLATRPISAAAATTPSRAVAVATTPVRADPQTPPTRMLRPGSLLDITV